MLLHHYTHVVPALSSAEYLNIITYYYHKYRVISELRAVQYYYIHKYSVAAGLIYF